MFIKIVIFFSYKHMFLDFFADEHLFLKVDACSESTISESGLIAGSC
jgi:hypothetical protein